MKRILLLAMAAAVAAQSAHAGEHLTAAAIRARAAANPNAPLNLAGMSMTGEDLTGLDLSGADLRGADLAGANLHGAKLVGADLTGAKLMHADLTFAWIIKAKFDHADLRGATMQTVVTSHAMQNTPEEAASFVGADLSGSDANVHFSFDDMHGANLAGVKMSVVMMNQSMGLLRSEFNSTNLDNATFENAGLGRITFQYAKLRHANFRNADLTRADFTGAYLDGADFTGATVKDAVFDGASLSGVIGLTH